MTSTGDDATIDPMLAGIRLSTEEAVKLEAELVEAPENHAARATLLAFYFSRMNDASTIKTRQEHIMWFIHNKPAADIAAKLLQLGEREAVAEYVRKCSKFWAMDMGLCAQWLTQIENGENIVFSTKEMFAKFEESI